LGGKIWADGYYVGTVGEGANWETVQKYVQKQAKSKASIKQLEAFECSLIPQDFVQIRGLFFLNAKCHAPT
jgi:GH24 family phage-related lysozyme (muramidase)